MRLEENSPQEAEREFEVLYCAEYEGLCRYAASLLGSSEEGISGRAEDAVQEMFVLALEKREEVLSSPAPVGWLYRALNYKVKELRFEDRQWAKRLMQAAGQWNTDHRDDIGADVELEGIVPSEDYTLLKRIYVDGCSYQELCAELHIKKSTLGMRVKRIKEHYLQAFKD